WTPQNKEVNHLDLSLVLYLPRRMWRCLLRTELLKTRTKACTMIKTLADGVIMADEFYFTTLCENLNVCYFPDNRFLIRSPGSSSKLIWGLIKEGILGKPVNTHVTNKAVYVYPTKKLLCPDLSAFPYEKHDLKKCPPAS
ncbi:unnamed protein product, partial [Prunus brigantina]